MLTEELMREFYPVGLPVVRGDFCDIVMIISRPVRSREIDP